MANFKDAKLALLIDADNISFKYIDAILEETTKYGTCTFRRIYGDWASPHLKGWKGITLEYALNPVQQYGYTAKKNATDTAITIDAMDMLHTAELDGFIIVSSDSDFTPLAMRLREGGKLIIGMGEEKTPAPFKSACNQFIHIENIFVETPTEDQKEEPQPPKKQKVERKTMSLLKATINDLSEDEDGWVALSSIGNTLLKKKPDFDPRTYGYKKLIDLFRSLKEFEVQGHKTDKGAINYDARIKPKRKS